MTSVRLIDELDLVGIGESGSMRLITRQQREDLMFQLGYNLAAAVAQNIPVEHFITGVLKAAFEVGL